jgi:hypothetical protein
MPFGTDKPNCIYRLNAKLFDTMHAAFKAFKKSGIEKWVPNKAKKQNEIKENDITIQTKFNIDVNHSKIRKVKFLEKTELFPMYA